MLQYLLFYKPYEVLSQFSPEAGKKTLADFLPGVSKEVYPVGRLDYDSEGLLLLTNDKAITHRLLTPSFKHPRTYWVQVEGDVSEQALRQLTDGVTIRIDGRDYTTLPAVARKLEPAPEVPARNPPIRFRKSVPDSWLSLTLIEGKNRQVRRMTAAVGFPTLRLIRYRIGQVTMEGLMPGDFRSLENKEVRQLLHTAAG